MRPEILILCAVLTSAIAPAYAAGSKAMLLGDRLKIESPCAQHVSIEVAHALHGVAIIEATADHQEEIDRLITQSGDGVSIRTQPGGCWRSELHPTLVLVVRVPQHFPVAIDEGDVGDYAIGDIGGPLQAALSGMARLAAGAVTQLDLDLSGTGDVRIASVTGNAKLELSGAGHVEIAKAAMASLAVDLSGAGSLKIGSGQIAMLKAEDSGFGSIRIDAVVGDASAELSGVGNLELEKLIGTLQKEESGSGTVRVANKNDHD